MRAQKLYQVAAVCLTLIASPAFGVDSKPIATYPGFFNGNAYRHLADSDRRHYVAGIIDGYLAAGLIAGTTLSSKTDFYLANCLMKANMTDEQAAAIVDHYLQENPELWGQSMQFLALNAVLKACTKLALNK